MSPPKWAAVLGVRPGGGWVNTAVELYVSIKTIEFHLGHIFAKLGIRSRRELITRLGASQPRLTESQGRA